MRELTLFEIVTVAGGDGYFKVIVEADVPETCAHFVANTWERFLIQDLSYDEATSLIFASDFDTQDLEFAFLGLEVMYWH
jgi:hypothetical protein